MIRAIVNVDEKWNIGYQNNLLLRFKEDMEFFKNKTLNTACIMGRKTLESFPNKEPLKNRLNIVLTKNVKKYEEIYNSKQNAAEVKFYSSKNEILNNLPLGDVYVIGGEQIYKMFLNECEEIYVTKMHKLFIADASFPNLDENKNFILYEKSDLLFSEKNNLHYEFLTYKNIN